MLQSIPLRFSLLLFLSSSSSFTLRKLPLSSRRFSLDRRNDLASPLSFHSPDVSLLTPEETNKYDIYKKKKNSPQDETEGKKQSKSQQKKIQQLKQAISSQTSLFTQYYTEQYGEERWSILREALLRPGRHVAMANKYAEEAKVKHVLGLEEEKSLPFLPGFMRNIFIHKEDLMDIKNEKERIKDDNSYSIYTHRWPSPSAPESLDLQGLYPYYPLDAASLLPVLLLQLEPHHSVLDVCSAPGGKALAILDYLELSPYEIEEEDSDIDKNEKVNDEKNEEFLNSYGKLVCNDVSFDRRMRLKNVISNYLPPIQAKQVRIRGYDASSSKFIRQISFNKEKFDRILLDAPCASERHLLQAGEEEIMKWSVGRSKNNAERQLNLLLNSLNVLKMNGVLVYSTCAVTNVENDNIIKKMLDKIEKKQSKLTYKVELLPVNNLSLPFGEPTKYGWHILPDKADGWGPIYLSVLRKVKNS